MRHGMEYPQRKLSKSIVLLANAFWSTALGFTPWEIPRKSDPSLLQKRVVNDFFFRSYSSAPLALEY